MIPIASSVVEAGTAVPGTCGVPIATATCLITETTFWAFGWYVSKT